MTIKTRDKKDTMELIVLIYLNGSHISRLIIELMVTPASQLLKHSFRTPDPLIVFEVQLEYGSD